LFSVAAAIIIFAIPGMMLIWSTVYVKSGKSVTVRWKLPVFLQLLLVFIGVMIHIYLLLSYGFPLFQTSREIWIIMAIIFFLCGFMLVSNFIITKKIGNRTPAHNSKVVNIITGCIAFYMFITLFIAAPLGKKVAFAVSINEAIEATSKAKNEEFSVVLVNSEKDCLNRMKYYCRNQTYKNQFFIKNKLDKTQEVQVKIRALDSNSVELKVIDSKVITLEPSELRLLETEETFNDERIWNKFSFQTDRRVYGYQHQIRYRNPD